MRPEDDVDPIAGASRANQSTLLSALVGQRRTTHADKSASATIDHAQPNRQLASVQSKPSKPAVARMLAKAGGRTTFISKPPRPVPPFGTRISREFSGQIGLTSTGHPLSKPAPATGYRSPLL